MADERPTLEQHVSAAIVAAEQVYKNPHWREWAAGWLNGTDRGLDPTRAAMAIANAELEAAGPFNILGQAVSAAAARTACQLVIGMTTVATLRAAGQHDLADAVEDMTKTMAELACRVSLHAK
jgi:hypothetical protein